MQIVQFLGLPNCLRDVGYISSNEQLIHMVNLVLRAALRVSNLVAPQ